MINIAALIRGLYNKPALVSEDYADAVFTALENKDLSFFGDEREISNKPITITELRNHTVDSNSATAQETQTNKAVLLEIEGALTYKHKLSHSRMSSYQGMKEAFRELALDDSISIWVMDMSSGGGMAYQCFETARFIRDLADTHNKKLISYVDGQAASACYAIAAVSHEIISNPMSEVGNIGVVVTIKNDLPKEISDGKERLFITYGENKRPFTETGHLKKDFLAEIKLSVDELGKQFDNHVSTYRDLTEEEVKALGASSFKASKALELKLIDKIMEREEFLTYISSLLAVPNLNTSKESENLSDTNDTLTELQAQVEVLTVSNTKLETAFLAVTETNEKLSTQNEKMTEFMSKLSDDQAKAKHAKLVATLSEFSFVGDSEKMATVLATMETEDKDLFLTSFSAAVVAKEKADLESQETEDNSEMFEMVSTGLNAELADMTDMTKEIDNILEKKHGGKV